MCLSKEGKQEVKLVEEANNNNFVIQHNYHDHAHESFERNLSYCILPPCRGGVLKPFPIKLYEMLDQVEEDGNGDIVSWQPHGRCFVVRKSKEFLQQILPKYFKLSKVDSFKRQLNLYGFLRLTKGRDEGGYYHELFLRGKQFLANKIQRRKVKGTRVRARSNPTAEPNFWHMSWVGCCADSTSSSSSTATIPNTTIHHCGGGSDYSSFSNRGTFNSPTANKGVPSLIHTELLLSIPRKSTATKYGEIIGEIILPSNSILPNSYLPIQLVEKKELGESSCSFEGRHFHLVDEIEAPAAIK